ncbi:MAG: hypothetical protein PHF44_01545 [Candidatus Pacebacteria bacterium]|nr:hypothetical protein [Candidatus Paceibacterota bacterium]
MKFLEKIQNLPERKRKIILWILVSLIGIILLFWYVKVFQSRFKSFNKEEIQKELNLPDLKEKMQDLPAFGLPNLNATSAQ